MVAIVEGGKEPVGSRGSGKVAGHPPPHPLHTMLVDGLGADHGASWPRANHGVAAEELEGHGS